MKYRCPHCGQKGFSLTQKVLRYSKWTHRPKCSYCGNGATIHMWWRGKPIMRSLVDLLIFVAYFGVAVGLVAVAPPEQHNGSDIGMYLQFFWAPLLAWGLTTLVFHWLFCSFDREGWAEYADVNHFRFTAPATVRLWPRVRVGEIYLFRFPKRKRREDGPYLIGMVTNVEKDGDSQEVTVRVVKEYLMDAPLVDEELVLATEGDFSVDGVVSHTYRLPPEEE